MNNKSMGKTEFSAAYSAWFASYEAERRHQKKRSGARLPDFPEPPASPERIAELIDAIGQHRALDLLGVHRATVARWLAGRAVIPRASYLLLVAVGEGRLPGMSEDWRQWRFIGDALCLVGTRQTYTARELAGIPYQQMHAAALTRQIAILEEKIRYLLRVGDFEAQNDALINAR